MAGKSKSGSLFGYLFFGALLIYSGYQSYATWGRFVIYGIAGLLAMLMVSLFVRIANGGAGKARRGSAAAKMPGRYELQVVGEQYEGRQKAIKKCEIGDTIALVRERDNKYDTNAVAVMSDAGKQLGYIPKDDAVWVAEILDRGEPIKAHIVRLYNRNDFRNVVIQINVVSRQDVAA